MHPDEATSCNSVNTAETSNYRSMAMADAVAADTSGDHDDEPMDLSGERRWRKRDGIITDYFSHRYTVQDQILCVGGQGTIKRAYDNYQEKPVAIKFF